jgi:hypothetical protein
MGAVDADMGLIAKGGDRDIDVLCSVLGGLGLGELDRPACVAVRAGAWRAWLFKPRGCCLP